MRHSRAAIVSALALSLLACDGQLAQREYVYTRQEPASGRRSPTVFVVRLRIDPSSKTVVWLEDVHDSDGPLGRNTQTWTDCTILDAANWECPPFPPLGETLIAVEMKEGQLHQF